MKGSMKKQTVGCFFLGAVVGAAVALLYAPKAGTRLRRDVKDYVEDGRNRLRKIVKIS
jgi:gas vesicle protein